MRSPRPPLHSSPTSRQCAPVSISQLFFQNSSSSSVASTNPMYRLARLGLLTIFTLNTCVGNSQNARSSLRLSLLCSTLRPSSDIRSPEVHLEREKRAAAHAIHTEFKGRINTEYRVLVHKYSTLYEYSAFILFWNLILK